MIPLRGRAGSDRPHLASCRILSQRCFELLEDRNVLASVSFLQHIVEPSYANGRLETTDLADVDQDGDMDIVSVGALSLSVAWYENVNGTFGPKQIIDQVDPISEERFSVARSVATGDLDGDGDTDVVATLRRRIVWYENVDGRGSFGSRQVIGDIEEVDDPTIRDIADIGLVSLHDINGDGDLDITAVTTQRIYWFDNNGDSEYSRRLGGNIEVGVSSFSRPFFAADMDGDGDVDFVTRDGGTLVLLRYAGTEFEREAIELSGQVISVFTADMDGDGDPDILVNHSSNDVGISQASWVENMDGAFTTARRIFSTDEWTGNSIHAADVDGDGANDVVVADAWYRNRGLAETFEREPAPGNSGLSADIDQDGDIDLVSYRSGELIEWQENDSQGTFLRHTVASQAFGTLSLGAADFDGDQDLDILTVSRTLDSNLLAWYENIGEGSFGRQQRLTLSWPEESYFVAYTAHVTDIDHDGDIDIIAAGYIGSTRGSQRDDSFYGISLYENTNGLGEFAPRLVASLGQESPSRPIGVTSGDFDGDGDMDLVAATTGGAVFLVRFAESIAQFDEPKCRENSTLSRFPCSF